MARGELLSVLGLYQFDDSIFDKFVFPQEIQKDVLVNNILLDTAELEVLYSNPSVLKDAIGFWSKSRLKAWEDMKNVLIVENYRPFINLERKESGYDLETRNLKTKEVGSGTSSRTGNEKTTSSENVKGDSTQDVLNKISAFNSSSLENKDSSTTTTSSDSSSSGNISSSNSDSSSSSNQSNVDNTGTVRNEYEHTFEGDSAMFTKQNIIEQEMEMRLKYDLYKIIIDEFKMKFCLLIY